MKATLLQQVRKIETLERAWRVIYENGRSSRSIETRREIRDFAANAAARITTLQRQLNRHTFKFMPAKGVAIPKEGKRGIRPLVIAPIESRIVQRAVHDVIMRVSAIREYIESDYSFGGVKKRNGSPLAAVPAAIQSVLASIGEGANYVIRSDITSFFINIPKPVVTKIIADAVREPEFVEFFSKAIAVELANLASLRERASEFPLYEIGVAQGNSLSPLLGNLLLHKFDQEMNQNGCRCIRYIDDFIILAPNRAAGERQFAHAQILLKQYGLDVSPEKTFKGNVASGFEFLGIEMVNGAIRPSRQSRRRLVQNVSDLFAVSAKAFRAQRKHGELNRAHSLIRTLAEASEIINGWGKHYFFCNEKNVFSQLDAELDRLIGEYLGAYSAARKVTNEKGGRRLIGISLLSEISKAPFIWRTPKAILPAA
jgi:retron-type reverse transcriptase